MGEANSRRRNYTGTSSKKHRNKDGRGGTGMLRLTNPRALGTVNFRSWDLGRPVASRQGPYHSASMVWQQCGCTVASDLASSRRPRALQHIGQNTSEWRSWPSSPETHIIVPRWNKTQLLGAGVAPPSRRFADWASHCRAPMYGQAWAGIGRVAWCGP